MATAVSETSLLNVHVDGKAMLQKMLVDRLVVLKGGNASTILYLKAKSLAAVKFGKSKVKGKSKDVVISGKEMHIQQLAINNFKKVQLERVMAFKNEPVPLS